MRPNLCKKKRVEKVYIFFYYAYLLLVYLAYFIWIANKYLYWNITPTAKIPLSLILGRKGPVGNYEWMRKKNVALKYHINLKGHPKINKIKEKNIRTPGWET